MEKETVDILNEVGNVWEHSVNPDEERRIFQKIAEIDGIQEYLRAVLSDDMKRYFSAITPKEQDLVRGGFSRALYWRKLLKSLESTPTKAKKTRAKVKPINTRYA